MRKTDLVQASIQGDCIATAVCRKSSQKLNASGLVLVGLLGLGSLASLDAHALALGRLIALSSIGEPLRAEVDILDLTPAEASSLRASLVTEETYKAMGLDYNPDLNSMQFILLRSPDGRAVLQLNNSKPVTAVFVDIVVEVSWAAGKIRRDFTLLMTPPKADNAAGPVTPFTPVTAALPPGSTPVASSGPTSAKTAAETPISQRAPQQAKASASPMPSTIAASAKQIDVVRGNTASQLVIESLPLNVSLDQMLLALLRSNPDAFVADNVNRLKAGALLAMPTAAEASTVSRAQAHQTIVAQSRDFNAYRQQLASNARTAQVAKPGRNASGVVQSKVEEKTPAVADTDKLTLSKGALKGAPAGTINAEEKIAQERQAKDAGRRLAELSKNIIDLNKLGVDPTTAAPPALAVDSPPAVSGAAVRAYDELNGLIDRLSSHPAALPAGTGLLGLLSAWIFFRWRRKSADKNNSPHSAKVAPISATKGFSQPTKPQVHSDRQEPFEGDPLTSAQDELAPSREAEALLRSALKRVLQPLAVHIELMDLYITRNDIANFEKLAIEALTITKGQGANWERICKKGQSFDPKNPLYQSTAPIPVPSTLSV